MAFPDQELSIANITLGDIELNKIVKKQNQFIIPNYQRGYKWTKQQVEDLLNDIMDFTPGKNSKFYCLQPIVVKTISIDEYIKKTFIPPTELNESYQYYEVIDGQQRLTTIYLILCYLDVGDIIYSLNYETRKESYNFLKNFTDYNKYKENINKFYEKNSDFFYIKTAYDTISTFFSIKFQKINKDIYLNKLLNDVKIIWYNINDKKENPIKVFERLNIGKISLSNSELIKALLLKKSNFNNNPYMYQLQISSEWDNMEYSLQDNNFWYFINNTSPRYSTRINFIFDLIAQNDYLEINKNNKIESLLGNDNFRTFRYIYYYFNNIQQDEIINTFWPIVKHYFNIFREWFNDIYLYHYIGFSINTNIKPLKELLIIWNSSDTKIDFINKLKDLIRNSAVLKVFKNRDKITNKLTLDDDFLGSSKTKIRPFLLLHNIETIIQQNNSYINNYKDGIYYKFPFHLYNIENWDIEHIDSATTKELDKNDITEYFLSIIVTLDKDQDRDSINEIIKSLKEEDNETEINNLLFKYKQKEQKNKNRLWNFTLLDSHTNRSYGNSIFSVKRRVIIGKDQGIKYTYDYENFCIIEEKKDEYISFVPICTKNVFTKYYNEKPNDLSRWTLDDGNAYIENIKKVLKDYIK